MSRSLTPDAALGATLRGMAVALDVSMVELSAAVEGRNLSTVACPW
jgi:hypothetical protein